jgi:flagellar basal-body rod modification protein FlgD
MSLASVTAQQSLAAAATSTTSQTSSSTSQTGSTALNSLSSNFSDFLQLLMTQLKNQDPSSPMDTNEFTSELVQFASVEQQINTNTSLTQLIQATQGSEMMQASSIVGKSVTVNSDHVALQNGTGTIQFTAPAAEQVAIGIYNDSGTELYTTAINARKGSNTWTWDGSSSSGSTLPDGSYKVAMIGANSDGTTSPLTFSVIGTATGVQNNSSGVQLQMGALSVDFSKVQSVSN